MKPIEPSCGLVVAAALALAGCHEIPQDAHKPFAPAQETKLYEGKPYDGNKAVFEKALTARSRSQNEYIRMGDAKTP
jgi:starvation-inducible outer membrane lipoprotein